MSLSEKTQPETRKSNGFELRALAATDHESTSLLLHGSLVHWYETRLKQGCRFGPRHEPFRLFPEVYAALDPGEAVAAIDRSSGELLGVTFVHPRPTHIALGIVAVAPSAQGRGVARAMLDPVLQTAQRTSRPVRLVSSALNLDSFSLYSRLGFVPHTIYQDLSLTVPQEGMKAPPPEGAMRIRRVTDPAAAARLERFEFELQGLRRERDYTFFLQNRVGDWAVWASENVAGKMDGFLVASLHSGCVMLGPGVALNEPAAAALIWTALDTMRGMSPVFLVPSQAHSLVRQCYAWGARNVELHLAQATGAVWRGGGLAFPTFLPETG